MTFQALHNAIRSRFKTEVELTQGVNVVYDNAPDSHQDDETWIRVSVRPGVTSQADSAPTFRTVGVMIASIFQPIEQGDKDSLVLADVVAVAFRRLTASGVKFFVPSINVVGRDGKWWQTNVRCPFRCDEINP